MLKTSYSLGEGDAGYGEGNPWTNRVGDALSDVWGRVTGAFTVNPAVVPGQASEDVVQIPSMEENVGAAIKRGLPAVTPGMKTEAQVADWNASPSIPEASSFPWLWVGLGVAAAAVVGGVVYSRRKR